jgi:hypothetical protein
METKSRGGAEGGLQGYIGSKDTVTWHRMVEAARQTTVVAVSSLLYYYRGGRMK